MENLQADGSVNGLLFYTKNDKIVAGRTIRHAIELILNEKCETLYELEELSKKYDSFNIKGIAEISKISFREMVEKADGRSNMVPWIEHHLHVDFQTASMLSFMITFEDCKTLKQCCSRCHNLNHQLNKHGFNIKEPTYEELNFFNGYKIMISTDGLGSNKKYTAIAVKGKDTSSIDQVLKVSEEDLCKFINEITLR
jgi:hypothetical protein